MEINEYIADNYVSVEVVTASRSKVGIILNGGMYMKFGSDKEKLKFMVEIDQKIKEFCPSKKICKRAAIEWGTETEKWVGKKFLFSIGTWMGKDIVNAIPLAEAQVTLNRNVPSPPGA